MIRFGVALASVVVLLDQASKAWALGELSRGAIVVAPGFFDLVLVHNEGAAFGLFTNLPPLWRILFLVGVALVASVMMLILLRKADRLWPATALGLVLGGAIGNLIDRLRLGWVVDFVHIHWHDLSWPVFNIADSAISVGITMLLLDHFRDARNSP